MNIEDLKRENAVPTFVNGMDEREVEAALREFKATLPIARPEYRGVVKDTIAALQERRRRLLSTEKRIAAVNAAIARNARIAGNVEGFKKASGSVSVTYREEERLADGSLRVIREVTK